VKSVFVGKVLLRLRYKAFLTNCYFSLHFLLQIHSYMVHNYLSQDGTIPMIQLLLSLKQIVMYSYKCQLLCHLHCSITN